MGWKIPTLAAVLWVIALTVVGTGLGVLIVGGEGALIGAIPLALGTVLAGLVPAIREAAHRRQDELARLEQEVASAQERWDAVAEPATEVVDRGLAVLLRPDRATIRFTGRETELEMLRAWCGSGDARSVRTIVGAGGIGKTRLALTVASEWESRGDEWRRVDAGQEVEAVAAARGVTSGPVLLLVDYAETRADLEAMLRAVLADPGPIRVLLVARSLGEWWDRLIEKSAFAVARLLTEAEPIRLTEQISQETSDANLLVDAIPQFALALRCLAPDQAEFELPTRRVPVLVLHTAALVAVLRFRDDPAASLRVVVADGVLDELLEHEARYWRRTAAANGPPELGTLLKPVVAVAALLGADSLVQAAELVRRVPELADASLSQRRQWARWLYSLYPPSDDGRLGSLQPDLLAEKLVATQLAADAEFAGKCLIDLYPQQAEHALTLLARASAHQDHALSIISTALHADLPHLALAAIKVSLETRSELGGLLARAIRDTPISLGELIRIEQSIPFPSVALAEAGVVTGRRVRESLPPDAEPNIAAEWAQRLGGRLAAISRWAEALPVAEEAAEMYRELAEANPGHYRTKLARALSNVSVFLAELGRLAEALPAAEEAVDICRELAEDADDGARYRADLAGALDGLGSRLAALGRPAEGLTFVREAVDIYRELVQADSDGERYRPDLARSLGNVAVRFSELGRVEEALPATAEAVEIYRELSQVNPDTYRPDLARTLTNLGVRLADLGRTAEAVLAAKEAVVVCRELAKVNPDSYLIALAMALNNLSNWFEQLGRPNDGLTLAEESVAIRRELAKASPSTYLLGLARSLDNLGMLLSRVGRAADGLPITEEGVAINRALVRTNPEAYRSELARSLSNLAERLWELGLAAKALPIAEEAAAMYRELVEVNPDRNRFGLAVSLDALGVALYEMGRAADALAAAEEAVALFRELADTRPERYRRELAEALAHLTKILVAVGRHAEADAARENAASLGHPIEPS